MAIRLKLINKEARNISRGPKKQKMDTVFRGKTAEISSQFFNMVIGGRASVDDSFGG